MGAVGFTAHTIHNSVGYIIGIVGAFVFCAHAVNNAIGCVIGGVGAFVFYPDVVDLHDRGVALCAVLRFTAHAIDGSKSIINSVTDLVLTKRRNPTNSTKQIVPYVPRMPTNGTPSSAVTT